MAASKVSPPSASGLATAIGASVLRAAEGDGLLACDLKGRIIFANPAAASFLGSDEPVGSELKRLLDGNGDVVLRLRFVSTLRDRAALEFVVARPDAEDEWIEVRSLPVSGGMAFFLKDVTDRERSERTLRRKEQRMRAASESLRIAHQAAKAATWEWRAGEQLRWLDIAAARALVGLPEELTGDEQISDWRSFVAPEDMPAVGEALRGLREADRVEFEYRVAGPSGHRWLRSSAAVAERRPDGSPGRVVGVTLDISGHKQAEAKLQREIQERVRAEQRQKLLIHELNHRVKNMLSTVQSVARQSLGRARGGGPLADFEDRLMALAWTHDILTREHWEGASLSEIVARTMAPYAKGDGVEISGPDLRISPKMALALAMGLHELTTNAVKYGALSAEGGRVVIRWSLEAGRLSLTWREHDGPPVEPPERRGFGSRLLERGLAHELGGHVALTFEPDGVRCVVEAPLDLPAPRLDRESPDAEQPAPALH